MISGDDIEAFKEFQSPQKGDIVTVELSPYISMQSVVTSVTISGVTVEGLTGVFVPVIKWRPKT